MRITQITFRDHDGKEKALVTFHQPGGPSSCVLDLLVWQHARQALETDPEFTIEEEPR